MVRAFALVPLLLGLFGLASGAWAQTERQVLVATVDGAIFPVVAEYVERVVSDAEAHNAVALVIQLDTPGGLDTSMRQINQSILASRVPVIVYVAPSGARAGSAGVYITYASHLAAMAPGTNIGSATPVQIGEGGEAEVSPEMRAKINNDAVAYIRGLAAHRGRNEQWAEQAVREAANVTAQQALELRIIEIVATDLDDLLRQANGRTVQTAAGPVTLATQGAPVQPLDMNAIEALLKVITDPTIAYLLVSLGSLGLFLELSNPGSVLPGSVGGIFLLLGLYGLGTLPVNYAGALLIAFAFLLFVADVLSASHGVLTVGGVVAFGLGSMLLVNAPDSAPFLAISLSAIVAVTLSFAAFFIFVASSVARTYRRKPVTGRDGLIGSVGVARTALGPRGMVFVGGELWSAVSSVPAAKGDALEVVGLEGLTLSVRPATRTSEAPASDVREGPSKPG